ncbi:hypothetical protein LC087_18845 (plasmid) [Bacillus carboniphilus]|uniref:DUF4352 domain-containing protein n=1 Tax=Bacillus carboniphilus TaxID=86663 RepID=A0ABY9JYH0_9BACI|nr:hypothetical protein [Bacillus carboniphilus]WLR44442.1 hypothetical protein LC087_18845 [Bacillus carboniphilus]
MRKFYILTLMLLFSISLVGCVEDKTSDNVKKEEEPKEGNPRILTEVGQVYEDKDSTTELMAIKDVDQTVDMGPLELTVDQIKIFKKYDMDERTIDFFSNFTSGYREEFEYAQITYKVENTEDRNVSVGYPIDAIVLSTGEHIESATNDFFAKNAGREFSGKSYKEGGISLIFESSTAEEIDSIKIITNDVFDDDTDEVIADPQQVTFEMK